MAGPLLTAYRVPLSFPRSCRTPPRTCRSPDVRSSCLSGGGFQLRNLTPRARRRFNNARERAPFRLEARDGVHNRIGLLVREQLWKDVFQRTPGIHWMRVSVHPGDTSAIDSNGAKKCGHDLGDMDVRTRAITDAHFGV